jgi:hypothetical protein
MVLMFGLGSDFRSRVRLACLSAMATMPAVPVSEEMHQRARREKQVREDSEQVRSMLGNKEEPGNQREPDEREFPD